jgi:type I restriction enzyme M protein
MNEKDPSTAYVLGMYYNQGRLYLFHRKNGKILCYNSARNGKGDASGVGDLNLHLPDEYFFIPSFENLKNKVNLTEDFTRAGRSIDDLETISELASQQMQDALSDVLRALDRQSLNNERGYRIFIETLATKIYDEKRNEETPSQKLDFYISEDEVKGHSLSDAKVQQFVKRLEKVHTAAKSRYKKILASPILNWKNIAHVEAVKAIILAFQDYSFLRSSSGDLYQIVFYNFANKFSQAEAAQFLTPLPVIDFVVSIVNPRDGETVFDPCCGIGDFLSLSFIHSLKKEDKWHLKDANIYGVDRDDSMIMLATLNMILSGDGEAKLFHQPDKGSILFKVEEGNPQNLLELLPDFNRNGDWDNRPDDKTLKKFDVVLTNPPFGKGRPYEVKTHQDREIIEMYEVWNLARGMSDGDDEAEGSKTKTKKTAAKESIDLGVVFLENAYQSLAEGGRMGIVVSNSIASINGFSAVRAWLMERMRIVAMFDLPPNIFGETGVNTAVIVAYKPAPDKLKKLNEDGYGIFVRDIQKVGYEKRTSKRNVFFNELYKIDETTFEVETDENGRPVKDEEFSQNIADFRAWALGQEEALQIAFLRED